MPDIRLSIDQEFINTLKVETGIEKATQLTTEALALLKWAVEETKKGRVLLSTDGDGKNPQRVVMPSLQRVKRIAEAS